MKCTYILNTEPSKSVFKLFCCVGTDKPTIELLNNHVSDNVTPRLFELAMKLMNSEQSKNYINTEYCTEMLKDWLKLDNEASWNKLTTALEQTDQKALAKSIKIDVLKGCYVFCMHMHASIDISG